MCRLHFSETSISPWRKENSSDEAHLSFDKTPEHTAAEFVIDSQETSTQQQGELETKLQTRKVWVSEITKHSFRLWLAFSIFWVSIHFKLKLKLDSCRCPVVSASKLKVFKVWVRVLQRSNLLPPPPPSLDHWRIFEQFGEDFTRPAQQKNVCVCVCVCVCGTAVSTQDLKSVHRRVSVFRLYFAVLTKSSRGVPQLNPTFLRSSVFLSPLTSSFTKTALITTKNVTMWVLFLIFRAVQGEPGGEVRILRSTHPSNPRYSSLSNDDVCHSEEERCPQFGLSDSTKV